MYIGLLKKFVLCTSCFGSTHNIVCKQNKGFSQTMLITFNFRLQDNLLCSISWITELKINVMAKLIF